MILVFDAILFVTFLCFVRISKWNKWMDERALHQHTVPF